MTTYPSITLIVLSYNSQPHLPTNMASIQALSYPADQLEIILVDNNSTDHTEAWMSQHYPKVRLVQTGANLGFAGGNNAGAVEAAGEWIVILNPDTRVAPNWLYELTRPLTQPNPPTAVASKVLSWDGKTIDFGDAAINFMGWGCQPGFRSANLHLYDKEKPLIFANGGSMLVHRQTFLDLGGFDSDYFAYYEDVDLGWRLWLAGHKIIYAPKAVVYHRHHGSWDKVADAKKWLLAERNTLFSLIKNYEGDTLARAFPAALLLLQQRVLLDINPDPALFEGVEMAPNTAVYTFKYYFSQFFQLIKKGQGRLLFHRVQAELQRRLASQTLPANSQANPTIMTDYQLPDTPSQTFYTSPTPLARLAAGVEILAQLDPLQQKRHLIQQLRQRSDQDIFPLFQWALISNFSDPRFIQAMNRVIDRFQIDQVVDGTAAPLNESIRQKSWLLSKKLLSLMVSIFEAADGKPEWFQIGASAPPEEIPITFDVVARVAAVNHLLWTMPALDLGELLDWLDLHLPDPNK